MNFHPTPFNDTCEPEDKSGWARATFKGRDGVTGREVVEEIWMPIGLNPRDVSSIEEPTSVMVTTILLSV